MVHLPVVQAEWCIYLWYRQSGVFTCGTGRVLCLPVVHSEWCKSGAFTCSTGRVVCLPVVQVELSVSLW